MRTAIVIALALVLASLAMGQQRSGIADDRNRWDIGPSLVPAAPAAAISVSVLVLQISLTNESADAVTCSVLDKADTPRAIVGSAAAPISVPGTGVYVMTFPFGRRASGGITWSCSSGTAITGHVVFAYPNR